jgi:hypothetical protein
VFAECLLAVADATQTVTRENTVALARAADQLDAAAPKALRPYLLTIVADLWRRLGEVDQGLSLVDQADAIVRQTTERWAAPEICRVRGALLLDAGNPALAERALRTAVNAARAQSAAGWLPRALRDLRELLVRTGRAGEIGDLAEPGHTMQ